MQAGFAVVVLAQQAQVARKGAFVVYCGLTVAVASGLLGDGAVAGERPLGLPALVVEIVVNLRFARCAIDGSGEQWIGRPETLRLPAVFLDQSATVVVFTDQPLFVVEVVDGGAGFGQFFFYPFAHGVVAVAGDGVAVFSDFDQAFTAVVEVLPVRLYAGGVDGDVVIGVAFAPFDQVAVGVVFKVGVSLLGQLVKGVVV